MKKYFLLFGASLLAIGLFSLLFGLLGKQERSGQTPPPNPTPISNKQNFSIIRTLPAQDVTQLFPPIQQFAFVFSEPIDPKEVSYEVSPFVETYARQGPDQNTIIISTNDIWIEGVTTILILPDTRSLQGNILNDSFEYSFQSGFPDVDPDWAEWPI